MPSTEKLKRASSRSKASVQQTTEHAEQTAVIEWVKYSLGKYPELETLYAIPNGGGWRGTPFITKSGKKLPPLPALRFMKEGLKTGVPDLCLPVARGGYHSLYIEMKRYDGKLSKDQIRYQDLLVEQGHCVVTCYDANEAITVLMKYLANLLRV